MFALSPNSVTRGLLLFLVFAVVGCEKLSIEPDNYEYPLALSVQNKQSVAELRWSEATVSTFEEYFIMRSTDPIPDSPEPEVTGNTQIATRIDERKVTLFRDSNLPISDTLYYKVYARIAGRFLLSPTIKYVQNLHLIPLRADIIEHVAPDHTFIAFDRAAGRLFTYDYGNREILASKSFQLNFPLISYGASVNEILLSENSTVQFLDYPTLDVKTSLPIGPIRNAEYVNGWIYVIRTQFPYNFALYRRSDLSFRDELNILQADWRNFVVIPDQGDINNSTIYDFSQSGSARYVQNNTNLDLDLHSTEVLNGNALLVASHPQRREFIVSNTGAILDGNLQVVDMLDNGTIGFSLFSFSPDGRRLSGLTFLNNNHVVRVYDADDEYRFLEEFTLNNQISPVALFSDENAMHVVSLVFLSTGIQTLVNSFNY